MPFTRKEKTLLTFAGGAVVAGIFALLRRQENHLNELRGEVKSNHDALMVELGHNFNQTQAMFWLNDQVDLRSPLPPLRGYAISPDFAALLVSLMRVLRPTHVVELGAGASTLVTAYVLRDLDYGGQVTAIEAMPEFAEATRQLIREHALEHVASVIQAPLKPVKVKDQSWQWYDLEMIKGLKEIDFLMVDGPSQHLNPRPMVRYPALSLLKDCFSNETHILLDDTNRSHEHQIVDLWCQEYPEITQVRRYDDFEKGAVLLRYDH